MLHAYNMLLESGCVLIGLGGTSAVIFAIKRFLSELQKKHEALEYWLLVDDVVEDIERTLVKEPQAMSLQLVRTPDV